MVTDWMRLERMWNDVTDADNDTIGASCGMWTVRMEYSGEGLGPIAGEFDRVCVYAIRPCTTPLGCWPLDEVLE